MASSKIFCVSERLLLLFCQTDSSWSSAKDAESALLLVKETFLNASVLLERAPRPMSGDSRNSLYDKHTCVRNVKIGSKQSTGGYYCTCM